MKKSLKAAAAKHTENLNRITETAESLPDEGPGPLLVAYSGTPNIYYRDKDKAQVGEAFGKDGWEREFNPDSMCFNWMKRLSNGVTVTIMNAESTAGNPPIKF